MAKIIVFTDLDGTLLDLHTYSYQAALPALDCLREKGIPVVLCSSKTRAEQVVYRREMGIAAPFIVENGSAIFIPGDYFHGEYEFDREDNGYRIIELGTSYQQVRGVLEKVRKESGISFRGWGDMTAEEVAELTGLDITAAQLAKEREYSETLVLNGALAGVETLAAEMKKAGLNLITGTRYHTVVGDTDKGKAVNILTGLYRREWGNAVSIGLGDSGNDGPMLRQVDYPVLVQRPRGSWKEMDLPRLQRIRGIGPEGWAAAIKEIVPGLLAKT